MAPFILCRSRGWRSILAAPNRAGNNVSLPGGLAAAEFVEDGDRGRGSAARGAKLPHSDQAVQIADAASRFDLHAFGTMCPHQREIVLGRPFVVVAAVRLFDETIPGRCLHPIRAGP